MAGSRMMSRAVRRRIDSAFRLEGIAMRSRFFALVAFSAANRRPAPIGSGPGLRGKMLRRDQVTVDASEPAMASARPVRSCRRHRAMTSRRCKVDFAADRQSTGWRQFPGCGSFRADRRPACSSARRPRSGSPQPTEHQRRPAVSQRSPSVMLGLGMSAKTLLPESLPAARSTSNTRICDGFSGPSVKPVSQI